MPAFLRCSVAAVRPRARLYPSIESGTFIRRLPGPRRWRGGRAASARVDAIDNVGSDAAARTEHAVLAAGEALEVTSAAHCRRSVLFVVRARLRVVAFCLRIARVVDRPPTGCSVHSLQAIAERNLLRVRAVVCVRTAAHNDLAIGMLDRELARPRKRATGPQRACDGDGKLERPTHSKPDTCPKAATRRYPSLHKQSAMLASV